MTTHHISAEFGPSDPLNPGFGYSIQITSTYSGAVLLTATKDPITGNELTTPQQCLQVLAYYCEVPPEQPTCARIAELEKTVKNRESEILELRNILMRG